MKGQFFILGGVLLCVLFYLGMPSTSQLVRTFTEDLKYLADNVELEIPKALNLGLNESKPITDLFDFTQVVNNMLSERNIDFTALWVVTQPKNSDVNITVGNFLGSLKTVTLNLSGDVKNLLVANNSTNSTLFSSVAAQFNLTISFDTTEKVLTLVRDKVNLYSSFELERGEDSAKREIEA